MNTPNFTPRPKQKIEAYQAFIATAEIHELESLCEVIEHDTTLSESEKMQVRSCLSQKIIELNHSAIQTCLNSTRAAYQAVLDMLELLHSAFTFASFKNNATNEWFSIVSILPEELTSRIDWICDVDELEKLWDDLEREYEWDPLLSQIRAYIGQRMLQLLSTYKQNS